MRSPIVDSFLQTPGWWYESWGVDDWLSTLFNQPLEVHTFVLGAAVGVVLAGMAASRRPRTTMTLTLAVLLFTFGIFDSALCSPEFTACLHVRLKPWYFVSGFLATYLFATGALNRMLGTTKTNEPHERAALRALAILDPKTGEPVSEGSEEGDVASVVAGLLVVVLVGFAVYSFVSPTPVHPVTGLATIGGLVGSTLGIGVREWARLDDGDGPSYRETLRKLLWSARRQTVIIVGYGTALGFGYPRLFWELGTTLGYDGFPWGPITWLRYGVASVGLYVAVLFIVCVVLVNLRLRRHDARLDGRRFTALLSGFVIYAVVLVLATGLAATVWFRVIPSA